MLDRLDKALYGDYDTNLLFNCFKFLCISCTLTFNKLMQGRHCTWRYCNPSFSLQHYNQYGNRMVSPDEEAMYEAQQAMYGGPPMSMGQEGRNAGYMTNLDSFSRTLENWHLRS